MRHTKSLTNFEKGKILAENPFLGFGKFPVASTYIPKTWNFHAIYTKTQKYKPNIILLDDAWFWSEEWQAKEKEVDIALAEGRFKDFNTIDEVIDYLHAQKNKTKKSKSKRKNN